MILGTMANSFDFFSMLFALVLSWLRVRTVVNLRTSTERLPKQSIGRICSWSKVILICFCWFIENYSSIFDFLLKNIFSGVFNTTIKEWHRWKLSWISTAIIYVGKTTLYFRIKVLKPLKKKSSRSNKAKYCYYNTIRTRIYFHVFESIMFS